MKLDRPLSPPLVHIERSLFGVSEMLIAAVERGETSAAIAAAVRSSPEWAETGSHGFGRRHGDRAVPSGRTPLPFSIFSIRVLPTVP